MGRPFLTVLIDTYNHERFIAQAITSVLEQDFSAADREIVVVDDGSTDRTPEIIRTFGSAVRVLRKANGGQASAFNAGIPEARGEIVAFLDGDDWWAPRKLTRVAEAFGRNSSVGIVGHAIVEVHSEGHSKLVSPGREEKFSARERPGAEVFRLRKCFLGTSRMAIRSTLLRELLPVPQDLVIEADEYLFTLAAVLRDVMLLPDPLTFYRLHGENLFVTAGRNDAGLRRKQRVQAALAGSLEQELPRRGISRETARVITEIISLETEQMRLTLDFGWPWQTVRTELEIQRIMHGRTSRTQRSFKTASLLPAMLLPSRWFYRGKSWLAQNPFYRRVRNRWLPVPELQQIEAGWNAQR